MVKPCTLATTYGQHEEEQDRVLLHAKEPVHMYPLTTRDRYARAFAGVAGVKVWHWSISVSASHSSSSSSSSSSNLLLWQNLVLQMQ